MKKINTISFCFLFLILISFHASARKSGEKDGHFLVPTLAKTKQLRSFGLKDITVDAKNFQDTVPPGTVKGLVLDETKKPQTYATVSLINVTDTTIIVNILTDLKGQFVFSSVKPDKYRMRVTTIGYLPSVSQVFTITANQRGISLDTIIMVPSPGQLAEVRIVVRRPAVERRADRFIVNVENSAMSAGSSVQLLKTAPFVQVSANNEISLQGKKTLVLIDSKPYPESTIGDILQSLPAGNIVKLELITNPSAKYDAAYGAVINIVTKKNQLEGVTGNVRFEGSYGSYGRYNANSSITYKNKSMTIFGAVNYENQDVYINTSQVRQFFSGQDQSQLVDNNLRRVKNNLYSFQAGADFILNKNQTIGAIINGNIRNWNGKIISNDLFGKLNADPDSILTTNSTAENKSSTLNYNINYHFIGDSAKNELTALATYTSYDSKLVQNFPSILKDANGNVIRIPQTFNTLNNPAINIFISQVDFSHVFGKRIRLEGGFKFQSTASQSDISYNLEDNGNNINDPEKSSRNKLNEKIFAAYGTLSKGWGEKDKLQIGLRVEKTKADNFGVFSQNYTQFFPNVSYEHDFSEAYNFSLSYKRTLSRVPYDELVPYTIFIDPYTVFQGNPNLKPRFDNEYDLNIKIHGLNFGGTFLSSRNAFAQFPTNESFDSKVTYFSMQNLSSSHDLYLWASYPVKVNSWWTIENTLSPIGKSVAEGNVLNRPFSVSSTWWNVKSNHMFRIAKGMKFQLLGYYYSAYSSGLTNYKHIGNIDASILITVLAGRGEIRLRGNDILKRNVTRSYQNFGTYVSSNSYFEDSQRVSLGFTFNFGRTKISAPDKNLGNDDAVGRIK